MQRKICPESSEKHRPSQGSRKQIAMISLCGAVFPCLLWDNAGARGVGECKGEVAGMRGGGIVERSSLPLVCIRSGDCMAFILV